MRIPTNALIPPEKLQYLLSPREQDDKCEFLMRLGFAVDAFGILEQAIRQHAEAVEAVADGVDVYGERFVVVALLDGPVAGRLVRSVWVRRTGETTVRFVTMYPT